MQLRIMVQINPDPGDYGNGSTGNLSFAEEAQLTGAGFETVSKVFTKCHDLLQVLKDEHAKSTPPLRAR